MEKLKAFSKIATIIMLFFALVSFVVILIKSNGSPKDTFGEFKWLIAIVGYLSIIAAAFISWVAITVFKDFEELQKKILEAYEKAGSHDEEKIFLAKSYSDSLERITKHWAELMVWKPLMEKRFEDIEADIRTLKKRRVPTKKRNA